MEVILQYCVKGIETDLAIVKVHSFYTALNNAMFCDTLLGIAFV